MYVHTINIQYNTNTNTYVCMICTYNRVSQVKEHVPQKWVILYTTFVLDGHTKSPKLLQNSGFQ